MTTPALPAHWRPWVAGLVTAIAAAIGWGPTMRAIDAGLAYYNANPTPDAPARTNAPPLQPIPVDPPTPPPSEDPDRQDAIDPAKVEMIGKHQQRLDVAEIQTRLYDLRQKNAGGDIEFRLDPMPAWRPTVAHDGGKKHSDGFVVMMFEDGGKWVGNVFDRHGVGQRGKVGHNFHNGYARAPAKGARWGLVIVAYNREQRSTVTLAAERWR